MQTACVNDLHDLYFNIDYNFITVKKNQSTNLVNLH